MSVPTSSPSDNSNYNCANGKVRIFIRSPTTPSPEDFSVLINLDSSVLALKQAIFETHPQKPIVRDQKLIYRGRVLNDTDTIVNVLRNGLETDQTFHLVVKPSFQAIAETTGIPISPPSSSSQSIRIPQENTSNITNPQINIQNQNQNYGPNGFVDFVHQIPYVYTPPNFAQYPYVVPSENAQTAQTQQQFPNNMQQQLHIPMSHNFFPMGQYYYVMINGIPYIAQYPYPYPYSYQYIITPQIGTQAQQPFAGQIPDPQQDVAARNQRRAATLWLIVKLFFLVYIFSQNASAERMILLYIFALVIFLYQTGRLRIVRRRRQRIIVPMPNELFAQQQQQQAPTVQDQEAQSPTQSDQNNNDPSTSSTSRQSSSSPVLNDNSNNNASSSSSQQQNVNDNNGNNSANEAQPNPQENIRSITWQDIEHAIWTFFTSLIPTNPPDVGQQDEVGM